MVLKKGIRLALSLSLKQEGKKTTIQNDKYGGDFEDAGAFLWAQLAERLTRLERTSCCIHQGGDAQPRGAVCLTCEASERGLLIIKDKSVWTETLAALQNAHQLYKLLQ